MQPKLKSLELHGYKTFASLTKFEFPGVVTAIVGPNGSGKSNIADAMRWVLGEQSYMLLRGRKTEDMIFSGSEQRPRSGMASATITFDNSDGWLPIDYCDVAITRRAYRDGQNEYLVNGHKVRLREISELLSQSGLSERTYTVIGQGLVDVALSLKPEERRKLFEEAAGIGLYRARREESLSRLDNTKRNLERVQDILVELEPRLRSLERQAKRAQEYERIKADLRLLMRDWYGYQWSKKQKEIKNARHILSHQENQIEEIREKRLSINGQLKSSRRQIQVYRDQLSGWYSDSSKIQQDREKNIRTLAILEERKNALGEKRRQVRIDLTRLDEELRDNQIRLSSATDEANQLRAEVDESKINLDKANLSLQTRQKEREQIELQLQKFRQNLLTIETKLVHLRARHSELDDRSSSLGKNIRELSDAIAAEETNQVDALKSLKLADSEKIKVNTLREALNIELSEYRQKRGVLENSRRQIIDTNLRLASENAKVKAQLDVIEQAEQAFSGLGEGAKFLLSANKKGKIAGAFRSLSSLIEVPPELEIAIEAALGEFIDLIVVEHGTDPETALILLEKESKGRGVLFPLDWFISGEKLIPKQDSELIGLASEKITYLHDAENVIGALLNQVMVVKNRNAARRLLIGMPVTAKAVTLSGEVFQGNGLVYSSSSNHPRTKVLSQPRTKRELIHNLKSGLAVVQSGDLEIRTLDIEIKALQDKEVQQQRDLSLANKTYEKTHQEHQKSLLKVEQVKQHSAWQSKQKVILEEQLITTRKDSSETLQEIEKVNAQIASTKDQINNTTQILEKIPLEELQSRVNHWSTSLAVTSRALREAGKRVEDFQRTQADRSNLAISLNERLGEIHQALESLDGESEVCKGNANILSQQVEELTLAITPTQNELEKIEKEYNLLLDVDAESQQTETNVERHFSQAQADLARQQEALENLQRRIEDDFGLVSYEYSTDVTSPTQLSFEGMVDELPHLTELPNDLENSITRMRGQLRRMGAVNHEALKEFEEVEERFEFMTSQVNDLKKADTDLRQVIVELDELMKIEFKRTFDAVAVEFRQMFTRLFGGGTAKLLVSDLDHPTEAGIDIEARLPGRRDQGLSLLSGGERSLTAISLIFALLKVSPTPFCIMDEVDAMLDETNVGRFRDLLRELSQTTQFILITHNRNTVQAANVVYGVTMGRDSASKVISLRLEDIPEELVV